MNDSQFNDCKQCFAVPGADSLIDVVHPKTGLSWYRGETLEQVQVRTPGAELTTVEAWSKAKAARQNTPVIWTETTQAKYDEMLNVLPPAIMLGGSFMVGEPYDHDALTGRARFSAYRVTGDKYFSASRPMTIAEFKACLATPIPLPNQD